MINNENDKKSEILVSALQERYQSMHIIRERVQNIGIWILGVLGGVGGWVLQSDKCLGFFNKILYLLALFAVFHVIRFHYLEDLNRGFKGQQKVASKIEKILNLYKPKFFSDDNDSVYPELWEKAGTKEGEGNFFKTTYLLIYIGFVFVSLSILFS